MFVCLIHLVGNDMGQCYPIADTGLVEVDGFLGIVFTVLFKSDYFDVVLSFFTGGMRTISGGNAALV